MKFRANEVFNGKYTTRNTTKSFVLVPFTLLIITLPLYLTRNSYESIPEISAVSNLNNSTEIKQCDIFSGKWIPYPEGPYYNNETCNLIIDQQNCMKFGRPDKEYLHWRWKPEECELPLFDATQFLKLVRGKKMAFVGDSVGRNQMQSLLCLLNHVSQPEDISARYSSDVTYFKRYFFADYSFTLATLWSPYFVRAGDADSNGHSYNSIMKLYLDEVDEAWASQVENFDIVIISAGHWFFRPLLFYENDQLVGCNKCGMENVTDLAHYYGYKKAFRTAFRTITNLRRFKGVTFFRTFSPSHFENGEWNKGGNCVRTKPFTKEEMKLDGYILETYLTQVREFKEAQKKARKRGLKFLMLDTTEIMLLRPDGHPNNYGHSKNNNVTLNDCVHWCLPGPVDTWNEFFLYMLNIQSETYYASKLKRVF
ncbi:protein trichome birefringence-like 19 [Gastrolobium bilobum]|uniref:protein trichome birefringence-like 19 n=1 Tax=Gastrolobium bilobum TaxID=150636 RepID=UPI002AB25D90|nr:protein trichome birefringence-like 19 [Gastrolobium bilobum]